MDAITLTITDVGTNPNGMIKVSYNRSDKFGILVQEFPAATKALDIQKALRALLALWQAEDEGKDDLKGLVGTTLR